MFQQFKLFLELYHHCKASSHSIISKVMCNFCLQYPPSHQWFHHWDVKQLLSLLESWAPGPSLTNFILTWKTAMLLTPVTAKYCSGLTLLHIDDQHLFLQFHAALFAAVSGGKRDKLGHLPPQIHSSINLYPVFYLKIYLCHAKPFREKSGGSQVSSLTLSNNRHHMPKCANWFLLG